MKSITMTEEQTALYDTGGNDSESREMWANLKRQAQRMANEAQEGVEIYTADGIVADYCLPQV